MTGMFTFEGGPHFTDTSRPINMLAVRRRQREWAASMRWSIAWHINGGVHGGEEQSGTRVVTNACHTAGKYVLTLVLDWLLYSADDAVVATDQNGAGTHSTARAVASPA